MSKNRKVKKIEVDKELTSAEIIELFHKSKDADFMNFLDAHPELFMHPQSVIIKEEE